MNWLDRLTDAAVWGPLLITAALYFLIRTIERTSFAQIIELRREVRTLQEEVTSSLADIQRGLDSANGTLEDIRGNTDTSHPSDWDK